jgi:hypothetical protein
MAGLEVCLFDTVRGVLCPVHQGDAIRIHTLLPDEPVWGAVQVAATRPLAVYELLRGVLEREGLSGTFVFEPAGSDGPVCEPFGNGDRVLAGEPDVPGLPGEHEHLPRMTRVETGRCIDVLLSGAGRMARSWREEPDLSPLLSEARDQSGHHALVMYLLSVHYSQPLGDVRAGLSEARARVERIREVAFSLSPGHPAPAEMRHHVDTCRLGLACDLDTPLAFHALFEWLRAAELREDTVGDLDLREMLTMLGLEALLDGAGVF